MTNGEYILPNYALKEFEIHDFKGIIKYVSIGGFPKEAKWLFLTGENGFGKTSLLQALALLLVPSSRFTIHNGYLADFFKKSSVSYHSFPSSHSVSPEDICAYGSSRLDIASENSKQEKKSIESLFDTQVLLKNIEYQLSRWAIKKESEKDEDKEFATKYEKVTNTLKALLNLHKITVDFKTDRVLYYEKDATDTQYKPVSFHQLAAGYRNIISMVGDMILRLFDTQPDVYDPAELSGIVIIDELDLHLHPKWQKRLSGLLSKIFPRVQFIASTHSPIPLLGAPEHSVFLKVNRDAENGITVERLEDMEKQISNLLPNTILSSPIFGMRDIFPVTHEPDTRIRTEDTYDEIKFNERVKQELKDYLGTDKAKELEQLFKSE